VRPFAVAMLTAVAFAFAMIRLATRNPMVAIDPRADAITAEPVG
jgi:hypothetical protein